MQITPTKLFICIINTFLLFCKFETFTGMTQHSLINTFDFAENSNDAARNHIAMDCASLNKHWHSLRFGITAGCKICYAALAAPATGIQTTSFMIGGVGLPASYALFCSKIHARSVPLI